MNFLTLLSGRILFRFGYMRWRVMTTYGAGCVEIPGFKNRASAIKYVARNLPSLAVIYVDPHHAFIFTKIAN